MTYLFLNLIMYLLLFFSPDWLTFGHMTISLLYKFTRFFIYFLFLSDEEPMLETLYYTIRIGSTPTFLYFDLYLCSAYATHFVYYLVCSWSKMLILELKCGCYIEINPQTILGKPSTHLYCRNAMIYFLTCKSHNESLFSLA